MRRVRAFCIVGLCCAAAMIGTSGVSFAVNLNDNVAMNIVGRWWLGGPTDHMSSTNPAEQPGGGTFEGQTFYLPAGAAAGRHPLYRLFSSPAFDHMDSTVAGEGGYSTETTLGYAFDGQVSGTAPVRRWYRGTWADHLTAFNGENPSGYALEGTLGYGYPRWGNQGEPQFACQGSQVRIVGNYAAGGAISELWWNNKQFVNDWDYGRQIQIAFNLQLPGETDNPTEAGDKYGWPGVKPAGWAHGSPLLHAGVSGTTLTTTCRPLQWSPENFGGGSNNPVVWNGTISKQVDLDFAGSPRILRWITTVNFPSSSSFLDMEIVTAYLNDEFRRFWAYDAAADGLSEMTGAVPNGGCLDPSADARLRPGAGGVMISTNDTAYALGVYRKDPGNNFGLCKFIGGSTGKYGGSTTKWNCLYRPGGAGVTAGPHSFTVYLVVGTVAQVRADMRSLYLQGF
jgi:hypothetical protein